MTPDAHELRVLGSEHDKTNKICQYPGGRPGPRPRFLHRETRFTIITDQPFDEKQRWIELHVPKAETHERPHAALSYTCDDLQKTYGELKKRGVEFENPPKNEPWGNYAIFKDS